MFKHNYSNFTNESKKGTCIMKKTLAILMCITSLMLVACNGPVPNSQVDPDQSTTAANDVVEHKCYEYKIEDGQTEGTFTENVLMTLRLPGDYSETEQERLRHTENAYYIGEFSNSSYTISVFQSMKDLDFGALLKMNDDWYVDDSNESYIKVLYKKFGDNLIGIAISSVDVETEVTTDTALSIIGEALSTSFTTPQTENNTQTSITVDGTFDKPAKLGEWVSTFIYNDLSKKYEPVLISITSVYFDNPNVSEIQRYNNEGIAKAEATARDDNIPNFPFEPIKTENDLVDVIFEYSVFYPNSYTAETAEDGSKVIRNIDIPITLVNTSKDSANPYTINSIMNVYKTIRQFNDVYEVTTTPGKDFTAGIGSYKMSDGYVKYFIKIDPGDSKYEPKYYSVY